MATFDITQLTASSVGVIDQLKAKLDNLKLVIIYKDSVITDIGVNNYFELGDQLIGDIYNMMDSVDVATKKLENIRFGSAPFPPCHTGPTGPIGWPTCP